MNKIYIYFRANGLKFGVNNNQSGFIPPKGPFFDIYMKTSSLLKREIQCISLSDDEFNEYKKFAILLNGTYFQGIRWLIKYYLDDMFDTIEEPEKKSLSNFIKLRGLYNYCLLGEEDNNCILYYKEILDKYFGHVRSFDAIRVGNMSSSYHGIAQWVIQESLPFGFTEDQFIVAEHTNMYLMSHILKSKVLFTQTKNRLSHAAIIAQELDIPCFLGIKDIYTKVFHGDTISFEKDSKTFFIRKRFYE